MDWEWTEEFSDPSWEIASENSAESGLVSIMTTAGRSDGKMKEACRAEKEKEKKDQGSWEDQ